MSETLLSALFGRGDETLIQSASGPLSATTLLRQAGVIASQLPPPTPGSEVAFSFEKDRAACTAALIATWATGHAAAVPEDGTKESIMPLLERKQNIAFLHDTGVGLGVHVPTLLAEEALGESPTWNPVAPERALLTTFLQPAIGEPTSASWTAAELLRDLTALAEQVDFPAGAHVASSLTPTALPNLLLGLLVPAIRGATFEAETPASTEALARQIREHQAHSLIATPAHARAIARLPKNKLTPLTALYGVDEGLDSRCAARLTDEHALRLVPVPALPLGVQQSALAAALSESFLSNESVDDIAVAVLHDPTGKPTQVFINIVGDELNIETCRAVASEHIPPGIRYEIAPQPALPRDANGRLPKWRTLLNFGYGRAEKALEPNLSWTELESTEAPVRRFQTRLPENYAFFEGHYTSYAVLAGAVQLHELVLPCVRRVEPRATTLTRLTGLKFMSRIAPGDELEVTVAHGSRPGELRFEILASGVRCSAGQLLFAIPAEDAAQ